MIPSQTGHVLLGTAVALFYGGAVMGIGISLLAVFMGRQAIATVRARVGLLGLLWLGFVIGQGILGVLWLVLSLGGIFHSWVIWVVCGLGWFLVCAMALTVQRQDLQPGRECWTGVLSFPYSQSWYFWVGMGIVVVGLFHGVIALLPPSVDDGLVRYLVLPRMIAATNRLEFQPFLHPYYNLQPLQVEMHWAALFAVSNETAVTVWDYLCALSFLSGIGFLAWSLTSSRKVVLVAVLMMLSTPAFYAMMGGGKIDNAAAQYGIAAFVWLVIWPAMGRRAVILAGLCVGWAMACRYTNIILLPALIVFAVLVARSPWKAFPVGTAINQLKRSWITNAFLGGAAAGIAGAPMLIKNWLLVGCPLAPQFGCQETFWAGIFRNVMSHAGNISVVDLLYYPFVWTFAMRDNMLGNISPLYIGFLPFLIVIHRRSFMVRSALIAGLAGVVSITTWLFIEPLMLLTRLLLVPLGLLAVPLSASVIAVEQDRRQDHTVRWLVKAAVAVVLVFLLFESRGVIYAGRYLASMDSRADQYQSSNGYDVAVWLNAHVQPGERVGLANYKGNRYFVDSHVLLNSETAEEIQWLWEHGEWRHDHSGSIAPSSWAPDFWHFYQSRGFTYIVIDKDRLQETIAAWPDNSARLALEVAAMGRRSGVLKIHKQQALYKAVSTN
jgi:dolichyl-phosphate-mannose-protein mannosyltransferase